jgi:hypothetical protein
LLYFAFTTSLSTSTELDVDSIIDENVDSIIDKVD